MHKSLKIIFLLLTAFIFGCSQEKSNNISAKDILGNPDYLAFSYGGYRHNTRDTVPTVKQLSS